jgi:hypothetical protein
MGFNGPIKMFAKSALIKHITLSVIILSIIMLGVMTSDKRGVQVRCINAWKYETFI